MNEAKQVIVIRRDLKMRRGKEIAQGSHASIAFLSNKLRNNQRSGLVHLTEPQWAWIEGRFVKICVQVDSEAELLEIKKKADEAGLTCNLITDAGLTEFNGQPTNTCLAIGPDWPDKIDAITGHLKLY